MTRPRIKLTNQKYVTALYAGLVTRIVRSTDSGHVWETLPVAAGTIQYLYFVTPQVGFYATSTNLYRTMDAGMTWQSVCSGSVRCVSFLDPNNGWACGDDALLKKTTDGGATWADEVIPDIDTTRLNGVCAVRYPWTGGYYAVCVGYVYSGKAVILRDTGSGWSLITATAPTYALAYVDMRVPTNAEPPVVVVHALASCNDTGTPMYSASGGLTWAAGDMGIYDAGNRRPLITSDTGRLVGNAAMHLFRSGDSGANYAALSTPPFATGAQALCKDPKDSQHVWAMGTTKLYETHDGGGSWIERTFPFGQTATQGTYMSAAAGYLTDGPSLVLEVA